MTLQTDRWTMRRAYTPVLVSAAGEACGCPECSRRLRTSRRLLLPPLKREHHHRGGERDPCDEQPRVPREGPERHLHVVADVHGWLGRPTAHHLR